MISKRDGHIRVLPTHVANKIAAGEVVERPASVVKELVENSIDAGAKRISISIIQGGRKLVAIQDDGCGMTKEDALLSFERQATSKILDVNDIEEIDTLGFRGEAIPSIASVSRFSMTTRRHESDEGVNIQVNAGVMADICAAGCPAGTLIEVRDLFCNVPARRKFLRSYATEESHVRQVFVIHALSHPQIGFSLTMDGREAYRLAPTENITDRIHDLFGEEFVENSLLIKKSEESEITVSGYIEKPNLSTPTRRDQYIFVNGRPATAPAIAYALREAYPRRVGDARPAAILFINLPPNQVDVNVHPTKREVRFRDNSAIKNAITEAIGNALKAPQAVILPQPIINTPSTPITKEVQPEVAPINVAKVEKYEPPTVIAEIASKSHPLTIAPMTPAAPVAMEFAIEPDSSRSRPWQWFKFLAQSAAGYLLIETDSGIVTINPHAARERIAYERLIYSDKNKRTAQTLLIPEIVKMSPVDAGRIKASLASITSLGFQIEEFGRDTFKIDAVPQEITGLSPTTILATIAKDLSDGVTRRSGERWREELIAKSIAKSHAGASITLTEDGATKMVEELCTCKMPYVCPRGKPVMIFTSNRELDRKFDRA